MSYVICRVAKFDKAKTAAVANHHARSKAAYESNPDIDPARSKNNFYFRSIANMKERVAQEIDKRAPMPKGKKRRKDAVLSFEVLISASPEWWPPNWKEMTQAQFHETQGYQYLLEAAKAMTARFGDENMVGAAIHLDEATPHMSVVFVPINKDHKLCAKEVLSKNVLQDIQTEIGALGAKYGLSRGVPKSGQDKVRHLSTEEYKAKAEIAKIRKEIDTTLAEYDKLRNELAEMKAENARLTKALALLDDIENEENDDDDIMRPS